MAWSRVTLSKVDRLLENCIGSSALDCGVGGRLLIWRLSWTMVLRRSAAQLDAFARGMILGMAAAGATGPAIAKAIKKSDGKAPTPRAVQQTIAKKRTYAASRGARSSTRGTVCTWPRKGSFTFQEWFGP